MAAEDQSAFLIATFHLGPALMGIDCLEVQEVIRAGDITNVPHAPDHILGIINLRGRIVTVMDLGKKLGLDAVEVTPDSRIIILNREDEYIGLLVDGVSDPVPADSTQIMPAPSNVKGIHGRFFAGVYNASNRLIALLNSERVLADER